MLYGKGGGRPIPVTAAEAVGISPCRGDEGPAAAPSPHRRRKYRRSACKKARPKKAAAKKPVRHSESRRRLAETTSASPDFVNQHPIVGRRPPADSGRYGCRRASMCGMRRAP